MRQPLSAAAVLDAGLEAPDLVDIDFRFVPRKLALDDLADLTGLDHSPLPCSVPGYPRTSCWRKRAS